LTVSHLEIVGLFLKCFGVKKKERKIVERKDKATVKKTVTNGIAMLDKCLGSCRKTEEKNLTKPRKNKS
jgi:hypothetical protein